MIRQIEAAHPRYLVFVQIKSSWLVRPDSERKILKWGERYARKCYDLAGIVDIVSKDETRFLWERETASYKPVSTNVVYVLRRRSDVPCAPGP